VLPLRDLASSQDIVVVPIPPDIVARTGDPAYVAAVIPALTYRGQAADIPTAAVQNYLVTHDGVSDDTVYGVTRALWSGLDRLAAAHPAAKAIELKRTLEGLPVPLHPGAQRYYQEIGLLK
jgi:TRAP transporter TAXI family solute receptor